VRTDKVWRGKGSAILCLWGVRGVKILLAAGAVGAIALAAAGSASATTELLLATYSGGTFNDGGTLSGSFVFDETTVSFLAWNVVTTAGSTFGGATYTNLDPEGGAAPEGVGFFAQVTDSFGDANVLELGSADLGALTGSLEGEEFVEADCATTCVQEDVRTVTGGIYNFTLVSVPEPATWALTTLGVGLAGVALRRQRRAALA
jgi:hypothetical protein